MTNRETMELFIEKNGQETVAYPFVEKDHVVFGNGMGIEDVIEQDVTMPTVTHEEVSFKVGVGDQDVSSSIVDSSVGEMVIKGQTYQNILPEPSTHILTNDKEMFKVNEGLDSSVEIVDGVAKSAILKGQTLVNILTEPITNHTFTTGKANTQNTTQLQANKKYIAFIDIANVTNEATGIYIRIHNTRPNGNGVILPIKDEKFTVGLHKLIFTMPSSSYNEFEIMIGFVRNAEATVTYNYAMVIEYQDGMENWDIPYFTGMQSVKVPVLKATGKNLFNLNEAYDDSEDNGISFSYKNTGVVLNGSRTDKTLNSTSRMLNINHLLKPGKTYSISSNYEGEIVCSFRLTKKDGSLDYKKTFEMNNQYSKADVYIQLAKNTTIDNFVNSEILIQFEESSSITPYEPFKSNILTTPEDLELRGIGDVKDELNLSTGEVVERIGEIMLDGSEGVWSKHSGLSTDEYDVYWTSNGFIPSVGKKMLSDKLGYSNPTTPNTFRVNDSGGIFIGVNKGVNINNYLSQNTPKIQYDLSQSIIKTVDLSIIDQDGNTPEGLHFFKDGHIQLSSGVDNSLIPTLNYQAKTSNSYVMDLMKTNTRYTMKAKSASGTFTIDGASYGAGTNGTFTTPSSMTNKFLVMSNKTNEEVMILEGDVVSKTIPYFKGIKSAFENEDKIEVLSTGKNLFDMNRRYDNITNAQATVVQNVDEITISSIESGTYVNVNFVLDKNFFKGKTVVGSCLYESDEKGIGTVQINYQDTTGKKYYQSIKTSKTFTFPDEFVGEVFLCVYANNTNTPQSNTVTVKNIQLELGTKSTTYDSHKSNVSKIPLLSSLRSLPDGTCDELIIDRESNKAKIIQRVGELDFSNLQYNTWNVSDSTLSKTVRFTWLSSNMSFYKVKDSSDGICDSIPYIRYNSSDTEHCRFDGSNPSAFMVWVDKSKLTSFDDKGLKKYLSTLPSTRVQYELATPVITEVDLEGFPYIYKDGHIFLNSEIAPTTQIIYSISQQHQISASTQDLIRHEQEIDYLYKLIAQYIQVDYQSTLLSLDLKLK